MKTLWKNAWYSIPILLFYNVGLLVLWAREHGQEILFFNNYREEPLNSLFKIATHFGEAWLFVVAIFFTLFWRFRFAVLIAVAGLITIPISYILKDQIGTDRPVTYFQKLGKNDQLVYVPGVRLAAGQTSFPSGHTMAAFELYTLLTLIAGIAYRKWGLLLALTAIVVGLSRIFLVQHFLIDVLGGSVMGIMLALLVWQLQQQPWFKNNKVLDGKIPNPFRNQAVP
jgi:membrane-associated phospholipid phosphatase